MIVLIYRENLTRRKQGNDIIKIRDEENRGVLGIWPRSCNLLVLGQGLGHGSHTVTGAVSCLLV